MSSGSGADRKGVNIPQAFDNGVQTRAGNVVKSLSEARAEAAKLQTRLSEFKKLAQTGNPEELFKEKTFWSGGFKATKTTDGGMHYTGKGRDGERLSVWTGSDGKIQIIEKEGQQFYSDGEHFQLKGKNTTFVEFADGTNLFKSTDGDQLQSRTADGYTSFKAQEGFSFTNFADGQGTSYEFGDGESFKTYAGGAQEHTFADGTKIRETFDTQGKPVTVYDSTDDTKDINFYTDDGKTYAYRDGGVADLVENVEFKPETGELTNLQTSPQEPVPGQTTMLGLSDIKPENIYFQAPDQTLEAKVPVRWIDANGISHEATITVNSTADMTTEALQKQVDAGIDQLAQDPKNGITPDLAPRLKEAAAQKVKENAALRPMTAEEQEAFQQVADANPISVAGMQELQNAAAAGGNNRKGEAETGLSNPPQKMTFPDGGTISWEPDNSYGMTAVRVNDNGETTYANFDGNYVKVDKDGKVLETGNKINKEIYEPDPENGIALAKEAEKAAAQEQTPEPVEQTVAQAEDETEDVAETAQQGNGQANNNTGDNTQTLTA